MRCGAVLLAAVAGAEQQPAFVFPSRLRWTYSFRTQDGVTGHGVGHADWSDSPTHPLYHVNETFDAASLTSSFRVATGVTAGGVGSGGHQYRYRYTTVDATSACVDAPMAVFPQRMFQPRTHHSRRVVGGVHCDRFDADFGSGAPGTLHLVTCSDVPQQTVWRSADSSVEQVSTLHTFHDLSGDDGFSDRLQHMVRSTLAVCAPPAQRPHAASSPHHAPVPEQSGGAQRQQRQQQQQQQQGRGQRAAAETKADQLPLADAQHMQQRVSSDALSVQQLAASDAAHALRGGGTLALQRMPVREAIQGWMSWSRAESAGGKATAADHTTPLVVVLAAIAAFAAGAALRYSR